MFCAREWNIIYRICRYWSFLTWNSPHLYSDQIPKSEQFRPSPPNPWLFADAVWVVMETCKFFKVFFWCADDWWLINTDEDDELHPGTLGCCWADGCCFYLGTALIANKAASKGDQKMATSLRQFNMTSHAIYLHREPELVDVRSLFFCTCLHRLECSVEGTITIRSSIQQHTITHSTVGLWSLEATRSCQLLATGTRDFQIFLLSVRHLDLVSQSVIKPLPIKKTQRYIQL